jgi:hypothetical protein
VIRTEIKNQVMSLGVASSRDLERLERRVARLEASAGRSPAKTTAKRTAAKTPAGKTTAKKSTASSKPAGSTDAQS